MAVFFPPASPPGSPPSEITVRAALATLSDDWRVFHSVVWQSVRGGRQGDGEADFVLLHPTHGILVLEVKGGRIEIVDGQWFSTDRRDVRHSIKDPFRQAKDSKFALLNYLKALGPRLPHPPGICHAVVFPDVALSGPIGLFPREIVLDSSDLARPGAGIEGILKHWDQWSRAPVTPEGLRVISDRLAPTLQVSRRLKAELADADRDLMSLTAQQVAVLRTVRSIRRCVVRGGAGTGKTVLAKEKARTMAADGARVLLCCYNAPLADRLVADMRNTGVDVSTFHSLCFRTAKNARLPIPASPSDEWWDREAPKLLVQAVIATLTRYDGVVIDEGQDFASEWLTALDTLTYSPGSSPFYVFTDSHQQVYRRSSNLPGDWPTAELDLNCRNTLPIARAVATVFRDPMPTLGAHGPEPTFVECDPGDEAPLVQSIVDRLIEEEHLKPTQIAVLAERRALVDELEHLGAGGFPFVPLGGLGVLAETISRFKGLEVDVVLLVLASAGIDDALLYVGASRARSKLIVVAPRAVRVRLGLG